jgi:hypothetical protein
LALVQSAGNFKQVTRGGKRDDVNRCVNGFWYVFCPILVYPQYLRIRNAAYNGTVYNCNEEGCVCYMLYVSLPFLIYSCDSCHRYFVYCNFLKEWCNSDAFESMRLLRRTAGQANSWQTGSFSSIMLLSQISTKKLFPYTRQKIEKERR